MAVALATEIIIYIYNPDLYVVDLCLCIVMFVRVCLEKKRVFTKLSSLSFTQSIEKKIFYYR